MNKNLCKTIGNQGEEIAAKYLLNKGYKIVGNNFNSRFGEIDIIAENTENIIFVEVKVRKKFSIISGCESVNLKKQEKIIKTSLKYISENIIEKQIRFDVIQIENFEKIKHIENAFNIDNLDDFSWR